MEVIEVTSPRILVKKGNYKIVRNYTGQKHNGDDWYVMILTTFKPHFPALEANQVLYKLKGSINRGYIGTMENI